MKQHNFRGKKAERRAFTLVELLVLAGLLAVFFAVLAPALARDRKGGRQFQCQNNTRQLIAAWQAYADEHAGRIVPNYSAPDGGWVYGWLDWSTSPDNTNMAYLSNPKWCKLAPYLNREINVFKCPADNYVSRIQQTRGWTRRVRSYSTAYWIGEPSSSGLPGNAGMYKAVKTMSDLVYPAPAETLVYVEEHPDSINDGAFLPPQLMDTLPDYPALHHDGSASMAFFDGHSGVHRWTGHLATGLTRAVSYSARNNLTVPAGDPDLHWISYHASRLSTNSF